MKKLILLHGALGAKSQLDSLGELLKSDFEIHTLDFEGHGDRLTDKQFSIDLFAENLLHYMNQHRLDVVNVFGYSMGGYVVLRLAQKYPERFDKIITLGTKFRWNPDEATKEVKMLNPEKIEEKVPAFANYLKTLHSAQDWKMVMKKTAQMMLDLGNGAAMTDSEFTSIKTKCFIGVGDNDTMVTQEGTKHIATIIPDAQFYSLTNTIHPIDKLDFEKMASKIKSVLE